MSQQALLPQLRNGLRVGHEACVSTLPVREFFIEDDVALNGSSCIAASGKARNAQSKLATCTLHSSGDIYFSLLNSPFRKLHGSRLYRVLQFTIYYSSLLFTEAKCRRFLSSPPSGFYTSLYCMRQPAQSIAVPEGKSPPTTCSLRTT